MWARVRSRSSSVSRSKAGETNPALESPATPQTSGLCHTTAAASPSSLSTPPTPTKRSRTLRSSVSFTRPVDAYTISNTPGKPASPSTKSQKRRPATPYPPKDGSSSSSSPRRPRSGTITPSNSEHARLPPAVPVQRPSETGSTPTEKRSVSFVSSCTAVNPSPPTPTGRFISSYPSDVDVSSSPSPTKRGDIPANASNFLPTPTHERTVSFSSVSGFVASIPNRIDGLRSGSFHAEGNQRVGPETDILGERHAVPSEHMAAYERTKQHVENATKSSVWLECGLEAVHAALELSEAALEFAPVAGLQVATHILLDIWDAVKVVQGNRLSCLRLTQRCADLLIAIKEEVLAAGKSVAHELQAAVNSFRKTLDCIRDVLLDLSQRSFLMRYIQREVISKEIAHCDTMLDDAKDMFIIATSVKNLSATLSVSVNISRFGAPQDCFTGANADRSITQAPEDKSPELMSAPSRSHINSDIMKAMELEFDVERDRADLNTTIREALAIGPEKELLEVLQIAQDEIPDVVKTIQRELEREVDRERESLMCKSDDDFFSVRSGHDTPPQDSESISVEGSSHAGRSASSDWSARDYQTVPDTLHREFLETVLDALRTAHGDFNHTLPRWTITKYEIERKERILVEDKNDFTSVYKGFWCSNTVVIRVLPENTSHRTYTEAMTKWDSLSHPNVLKLLGASSITCHTPLFFVTPFYQYGNLVKYLGQLDHEAWTEATDVGRMIYEVAGGMEYLHNQNIIHGDLKASNILVDDDRHCVIFNFGQTELVAGSITRDHTLHDRPQWGAPEISRGQVQFSRETDVYAFSITCAEMLNKGIRPGDTLDCTDSGHVLDADHRPMLRSHKSVTPSSLRVIESGWSSDNSSRPSFSQIVDSMRVIRSDNEENSISFPSACLRTRNDRFHYPPSPNLRPASPLDHVIGQHDLPLSKEENSMRVSPDAEKVSIGPDETTPERVGIRMPQPIRLQLSNPSSGTPSVTSLVSDTRSIGQQYNPGFRSPYPSDETQREAVNERRYRLLLRHQYHQSLTLPLWSPTHVSLGAVGYLSKPSGTFVTLFNAFDPPTTSRGRLPFMASLYGFGKVKTGSQFTGEKRNLAKRQLDSLQGLISPNAVSRQLSHPLRVGRRTAYLCTDSAKYRYMENLDIPKKWFHVYASQILDTYGSEHSLRKEDLYLVVGLLEASKYALYVSHRHSDSELAFNILSSQKPGKPWGAFEVRAPCSVSGVSGAPDYGESIGEADVYGEKVSYVKGQKEPPDAVLLARLRFRPDEAEPTSM